MAEGVWKERPGELFGKKFGRSPRFVVPCEAVIVLVEWTLLVAIYGCSRWRRLGLVAFVMNAASYGAGVLMAL